jgi:hypothetical protein
MHPMSRVAVPALLVATAVVSLTAAKPPRPGPATIAWSGASWELKTSSGAVGPGPNIFDKANVWVDANGALHLRIARNAAGQWTCAEILGPHYGYGTYTFNLASRVDALDQNAVLGLFTWSDRAQYANREIDIEFARWGNPADPTNGQYVVQPDDRPAHLKRITQPASSPSSHRFSWQQNRVSWESYDANGGGGRAVRLHGQRRPAHGRRAGASESLAVPRGRAGERRAGRSRVVHLRLRSLRRAIIPP